VIFVDVCILSIPEDQYLNLNSRKNVVSNVLVQLQENSLL